MSDFICVVCGGSAFPLWKDGELRDAHTVEPRGHEPVRPPVQVQPEYSEVGGCRCYYEGDEPRCPIHGLEHGRVVIPTVRRIDA